jgi:hypothetical protein
MSDRVAAMMAEIEAKQREVERIVAEEAKKNIVPPLIEVLEEEIEDSIETKRIAAMLSESQIRFTAANEGASAAAIAAAVAPDYCSSARRTAEHYRELMKKGENPDEIARHRVSAEFYDVRAVHYEHVSKMDSKTESRAPCLLLRAQLDAAKKDAEWKIQSFKIIDALTQRVAALEARLDAKETVPLGTPVLGSDPDSGEDSCEGSCEGSEEPVRRTLFPYW